MRKRYGGREEWEREKKRSSLNTYRQCFAYKYTLRWPDKARTQRERETRERGRKIRREGEIGRQGMANLCEHK